MWSGNFTAKAGIKGYGVLHRGDNKILEDDAELKKKRVYVLRLLNKTVSNELILSQEEMVWFQIVEDANTK